MLVLTRHAGGAIKIGDDVTIVVRKMTAPDDSANVHIGIDAPKTIKISHAKSPRKEPRFASRS